MVKPVRKASNKNPSILSHEFFIQNHADIISCIAMVFVVGLMIQATSPYASLFIVLQHNVTDAGGMYFYNPGSKDWAAVFFYSLICIVIHAVIQEYILDKMMKKLHLSKAKLTKFSNSGQLSIFHFVSTIWGIDVALKENYIPDISKLWLDYPAPMTFFSKLYIICQLAYSLHEIPELYFQRAKKEEYVTKMVNVLVSLALIYIPYILKPTMFLLHIRDIFTDSKEIVGEIKLKIEIFHNHSTTIHNNNNKKTLADFDITSTDNYKPIHADILFPLIESIFLTTIIYWWLSVHILRMYCEF